MVHITLHSQFLKLPIPTKTYEEQTIIVTGSNVGMGLEAARHFVRLGAAKVILAVRSTSKGLAAKSSIEASTKRFNVVEVWELDLASYASVLAFGERVKGLDRLDVVIENAGIYLFEFGMLEQDEATITVNVVSTMLLAMLLLPKLRESARVTGKTPVLSFTGSFTHEDTSFPERKAANIFEGLSMEKDARMSDRYRVSKLIELFCVRELADLITKSDKEKIIVSTINPGFVKTDVMRHAPFLQSLGIRFWQRTIARTTEVGGRILVNAAEGGQENHGQYLDDCKIGQVSEFVRSQEGAETQKRLWKELSTKLEKIKPGIMSNV